MEISFTGKTVLVTGASRGIGRATAELLVKCGAKVIAVDRLADGLQKLQEDIPNVITLCVDLSNWKETEEALKSVGPVDGLVNNAGIFEESWAGQVTEEACDRMHNINVKSIINVTQVITNKMKESGIKGSVVNLSSIASTHVHPRFLVYRGDKAAVDHLTRNFAKSLAGDGIRVNAVNPTIVKTQMANTCFVSKEEEESVRSQSLLGRFIETEEIASVIVFLLSSWAGAVTGVCMPISAGIFL